MPWADSQLGYIYTETTLFLRSEQMMERALLVASIVAEDGIPKELKDSVSLSLECDGLLLTVRSAHQEYGKAMLALALIVALYPTETTRPWKRLDPPYETLTRWWTALCRAEPKQVSFHLANPLAAVSR